VRADPGADQPVVPDSESGSSVLRLGHVGDEDERRRVAFQLGDVAALGFVGRQVRDQAGLVEPVAPIGQEVERRLAWYRKDRIARLGL
jgi:hypothetical protein